MREKLIELLSQVDACVCTLCGEDGALERVTGVIADHLIANGVTIQKWIPVTERLPEDDGECVLIVLRWGVVDIGWYYKQFECWKSEFVNRYEDGEITHWMPLPEPPKEVNGND